MTIIRIECKYCGEVYFKTDYSIKKTETCRRCNDKELSMMKKSDYLIDTYKGCPSFPEEEDPFGIYIEPEQYD